MKKKLSIGSWAYIFNQEKPTTDFHQVVHMLHDLGYDGVELGSFGLHPTPYSHPTKASRQQLKKRCLLLDDVEAMRLLTLILDRDCAVGLRVGRQLHFPERSLWRGLLAPSLRGNKNCAGKQSGYE